jgi:hypothetical protein
VCSIANTDPGPCHAGRQQALSEATLADTGGHLLAHATSRCVLMDIPGELPEPPAAPVTAPRYAGPHPFQRPAAGQPLPQDIWNTATGLQILRAAQRGGLPRSPLTNLLGAQLRDVADGLAVAEIPASGWFANETGTMYGGLQRRSLTTPSCARCSPPRPRAPPWRHSI